MNEENHFIFSKDTIIDYTKEELFDVEDVENDSYDTDVFTDSNNSVETFQFNNLLTAYNFNSKQITLWKEIGDDQYEILYECSTNGNLCRANFYVGNYVFILNDYNPKTGYIEKLAFTSKVCYSHAIDSFMKEPKSILGEKISYASTLRYIDEHFKTLIYNNKYIADDQDKWLIDEYQNLYAKYLSIYNHISVYNILRDFLADIHSYIATKEFDMNVFSKHLFKLYNFKEACPSSIALITSFIENYSGTDLQKLCDSLERNIRNIESLIHLYCKDELESQKEEEL